MEKKRGRPRTMVNKTEHLQIRLNGAEKEAFTDAAALAGQSLSVWVRDQLRKAARQQLEQAGQDVPFLKRREP